jgi:glyoxylase I family protein
METTHTHHVAIYTSNYARIRAFYVETLGLPVLGAFEGYNIVFIGTGSTAIEIVEDTDARADNGGWRHLALEVPDVDGAYRELTAKGIAFHALPENFPPEAPKMRIAFFRDPDGNEIELIEPLATRYP